MKVTARKILDALEDQGAVNFSRIYTSNVGLECKQRRTVQKESDYFHSFDYRISEDNGKTYGKWQSQDSIENYSKIYGEDEIIFDETKRVWNPVHSHYVSTRWNRFFLGGHKKSYREYWQEGKKTFFDHQYIAISDSPDGTPFSVKLVKYEDGVDFDPSNPADPEFLYKNCGAYHP